MKPTLHINDRKDLPRCRQSKRYSKLSASRLVSKA
jgi:hypothetical protein